MNKLTFSVGGRSRGKMKRIEKVHEQIQTIEFNYCGVYAHCTECPEYTIYKTCFKHALLNEYFGLLDKEEN